MICLLKTILKRIMLSWCVVHAWCRCWLAAMVPLHSAAGAGAETNNYGGCTAYFVVMISVLYWYYILPLS